MSASSGLSPQILLRKIADSLQVMAGRQPLAGSFGSDAAALWQAIGAGMIFTFLVTIYPGVGSSLSLFAATYIAQFIGVMLMLLLMQINQILKKLSKAINKSQPIPQPKFLNLKVPKKTKKTMTLMNLFQLLNSKGTTPSKTTTH